MHNIKFELTEEEMDELMDEIQDSTGSVDYKNLSKLIFEKMDTQPDERKKYKSKMAEIKAYFASKPEAA